MNNFFQRPQKPHCPLILIWVYIQPCWIEKYQNIFFRFLCYTRTIFRYWKLGIDKIIYVQAKLQVGVNPLPAWISSSFFSVLCISRIDIFMLFVSGKRKNSSMIYSKYKYIYMFTSRNFADLVVPVNKIIAQRKQKIKH